MIKSRTLISAAVFALLSACGGGSSDSKEEEKLSNDGTNTPQLAQFQGKVIDGYVSGATIWLDINGDGEQDKDNEPFTVSVDAGDYALELTEEQAECLPYSTLYVDVPIGAEDEDLGTVEEAYQMSFPPALEPISNEHIINISPFTTVLWETLKSYLEKERDEFVSCELLKSDVALRESIAEELKDIIRGVVQHYNISEEAIYVDFIASQDTDAHQKAMVIVDGLKVAYARKKEIELEHPDAHVGVFVYQENHEGVTRWVEQISISYEAADTYIWSLLTEDLSGVDRILGKIESQGRKWGPDKQDWLSTRTDISYLENGYSCSGLERIEVDRDTNHYEINNWAKGFDADTFEECNEKDFSLTTSKTYSWRYEEDVYEYGTEFYLSSGNAEFQAMYHWYNFVENEQTLDVDEMVEYLSTLPYRFEEDVNIDIDGWRKSKGEPGIVIHKDNSGYWERSTEQEDGTTLYECSDDGETWSENKCNTE